MAGCIFGLDVEPASGQWDRDDTGTIPIDGETFTHAMSQYDCFGNDGPYVFEYDLGRDYSSFESVVGMTDFTSSDWTSRFEFYVDGRPVPEATREVAVGSPSAVELGVADALRLKIIISTLSGGGCGYSDPTGPALGDPVLVR